MLATKLVKGCACQLQLARHVDLVICGAQWATSPVTGLTYGHIKFYFGPHITHERISVGLDCHSCTPTTSEVILSNAYFITINYLSQLMRSLVRPNNEFIDWFLIRVA